MHREFKQALPSARGESNSVVVAFVDIRSFSAFSGRLDSVETGLYVRKLYERILNDYFPFATYWKPTGDGLLVVTTYSENEQGTLEQALNLMVDAALRLTEEFKDILTADPMINFPPLPDKVGIGISRGTACRLVAGTGDGEKTLDYSGRLLNLAARLMDLARPEGVVIDGLAGIDLLTPERRTRFSKQRVYLRGVSPSQALDIYYTNGATIIPDINKRRLDEPSWAKINHQETFKKFRAVPDAFFQLPKKPAQPDEIVVFIRWPLMDPGGQRRAREFGRHRFKDFTYELVSGKPEVRLKLAKLIRRLEKEGIKDPWPIITQIRVPY